VTKINETLEDHGAPTRQTKRGLDRE